MSAEFMSIEGDLNEAMAFLEHLDVNKKKLQRRLLAGVGTSTKNAIKKQYKQSLHKRSGELYKSIKRNIVKSGNAVVIAPYARASNNVFYGFALAKGATIKAKNQDYLTFQVEGKWVKKKQVNLPERDYIVRPGRAYIESGQMKAQLDRLCQKEIEKAEKKAKEGAKK